MMCDKLSFDKYAFVLGNHYHSLNLLLHCIYFPKYANIESIATCKLFQVVINVIEF